MRQTQQKKKFEKSELKKDFTIESEMSFFHKICFSFFLQLFWIFFAIFYVNFFFAFRNLVFRTLKMWEEISSHNLQKNNNFSFDDFSTENTINLSWNKSKIPLQLAHPLDCRQLQSIKPSVPDFHSTVWPQSNQPNQHQQQCNQNRATLFETIRKKKIINQRNSSTQIGTRIDDRKSSTVFHATHTMFFRVLSIVLRPIVWWRYSALFIGQHLNQWEKNGGGGANTGRNTRLRQHILHCWRYIHIALVIRFTCSYFILMPRCVVILGAQNWFWRNFKMNNTFYTILRCLHSKLARNI